MFAVSNGIPALRLAGQADLQCGEANRIRVSGAIEEEDVDRDIDQFNDGTNDEAWTLK